MEPEDKEDIATKAMAVNADISIFQVNRNAKGAIIFDRV